MQDAEFKLMLYPVNKDYKADLTELESLLADIKFIGKKLSIQQFEVGENFLSQLTFMGCSPNIELKPQSNGSAFCYIEINESEGDTSQFIAGTNLKKGRCTHCKKEITQVDKKALCLQCNKPIELASINWRKTAFIAKTWITVGNIYELEAIPNDELLHTLEKQTDVKWKPAYIRNATRTNIQSTQ